MRQFKTRLKIGVIIVLLVIIFVGIYAFNQPNQAVISAKVPSQIQKNQSVTVPIEIDTQGYVINAVEAYLTFDPKVFKVESVSKDASFFQIWIEGQPSFSNSAGTISFAGGLPTPGFSGRGTIGAIVLMPLQPGTHRLTFDAKTRILLNDGLGSTVALKMRPVSMSVK